MMRLGVLAIAAYIAAIVAANWLTAHYGFVPVWPKPYLTATAGTYVIGCAFVFRILVQEACGRNWRGRIIMLAAILAGALLSWVLATPALALASGVTFAVSESLDWTGYSLLRPRGWAKAAAAGNAIGAVSDTFLFLWLAGFPIIAAAPGQLIGKAYATIIYLGIGWLVRRAVFRHAVNPAGA